MHYLNILLGIFNENTEVHIHTTKYKRSLGSLIFYNKITVFY